MSFSQPPEQGQIVTVRNRRYVVADVARNALKRSVLELPFTATQHLVPLMSIEDDAIRHSYRSSQALGRHC